MIAREPSAPTSGEINRAIETLRRADAQSELLDALDLWNSLRLRNAVARAASSQEVIDLFSGIASQTFAKAGIV